MSTLTTSEPISLTNLSISAVMLTSGISMLGAAYAAAPVTIPKAAIAAGLVYFGSKYAKDEASKLPSFTV